MMNPIINVEFEFIGSNLPFKVELESHERSQPISSNISELIQDFEVWNNSTEEIYLKTETKLLECYGDTTLKQFTVESAQIKQEPLVVEESELKTDGIEKSRTEGTNLNKQGNQPKPYKCGKCNYGAAQIRSLNRHVKYVHSLERSFKCNDCTYSATRKAYLIRHRLIHTGERPYKCKQCIYAARQSGSLSDHIKKFHSTERPFKCTKCNYSTSKKSSLTIHRFVHTEEKPYSCKLCEYSAKHPGRLQTHLKTTHLGVKLYKCSDCTYTSSREANMRGGGVVNARERVYKCRRCYNKVSQLNSLQNCIQTKWSKLRSNIFSKSS